MDQIGKVGKLENCTIDEEMRSQSGEMLCKSIMMENTRFWQIWKKKNKTDDITHKELP